MRVTTSTRSGSCPESLRTVESPKLTPNAAPCRRSITTASRVVSLRMRSGGRPRPRTVRKSSRGCAGTPTAPRSSISAWLDAAPKWASATASMTRPAPESSTASTASSLGCSRSPLKIRAPSTASDPTLSAIAVRSSSESRIANSPNSPWSAPSSFNAVIPSASRIPRPGPNPIARDSRRWPPQHRRYETGARPHTAVGPRLESRRAHSVRGRPATLSRSRRGGACPGSG